MEFPSGAFICNVALLAALFSSLSAAFEDGFHSTFDEMDKQDKIYEVFEKGMQNWEERCEASRGRATLDAWLKAQENLVACVMSNFDVSSLQREVEQKRNSGQLDDVFTKYCGAPVEKTRPCVEKMVRASRDCVEDPAEGSTAKDDVAMRMFDAAVEFACHNRGDRLALFMSEDGMGCLKSHQDAIMRCANQSIPELFHLGSAQSFDLSTANDEYCRKGDAARLCIESELLRCDDPTPSNIVNSLMLSMRKATSCPEILRAQHDPFASAAANVQVSSFVITTFFLVKGLPNH